MTKRILSIDGGGLRGVFSAAVIEQMEKVLDVKKASDAFDCFVGSSAGALLAAGLASGVSAGELKDIFIALGDEMSKKMGAAKTGGNPQLSSRQRAEEATIALKHLLIDVFGKDTKAHQLEKRFAVGTRDMERGKVVFFGNFPQDQVGSSSFWSASGTGDEDPPVWEMVLRSAALPPMFSPAGPYLDGGVSPFANPSYAACIGVQRCLGWIPSDEVVQCFSVGTGYHEASYSMTDDQGLPLEDAKMFSDMVGAMMQDINFLQHQIMKRVRSQRLTYKRYNVAFNQAGFERAGIPLEMAEKDGKLIFDVLAQTATPEVERLANIGTRFAENQVHAEDFDPKLAAQGSGPYVAFAADRPELLEGLHKYSSKPSPTETL